MDHIVIPVGQDHRRPIDALSRGAAAAAGLPAPRNRADPHVSVLAYEELSRDAAEGAIQDALREAAPFIVHAHGYGFFTGDHPENLTLHVPVVRTAALDAFHSGLWGGLHLAGARIAPWSAPDLWTPHITLLDRELDPTGLGAAATWLARRHHPSWSILVDRVVLTGGWPDRTGRVLRLGVREDL